MPLLYKMANTAKKSAYQGLKFAFAYLKSGIDIFSAIELFH